MSETVTVDPADKADANEPTISVEEGMNTDPHAESVRRQMEQSQKLVKDADTARRAAEQREQQSRAENAQLRDAQAAAQTRATQERAGRLAHEIDSANADITSAQMAYRAAREAGDVDAEFKAQQQLNNAQYRLNSAKGEQSAQPKEPTTEQRQQQVQQPTFRPEVQAWIDRNPRFNTDLAFKETAINAHHASKLQGIVENSAEYFDYVDRVIAEQHGGQQHQQQQERGGDAGPTNRGGQGSMEKRGQREYMTDAGPVIEIDNGRGKPPSYKVSQETAAIVREYAEITGFNKKGRGEGEYLTQLVKIAKERASGAVPDLRIGNGVSIR